MNKKAYEMSFAWIFAVLVGAFVIFLAIYAVFKVADVAKTGTDTTRAKEFGILLTPAETGLEETKVASIGVPRSQQTRLFSECVPPTLTNPFGTQKLSALVKSGIGSKWQPDPGVESSFHNKYLFAKEDIEGNKEFHVLSKPFKFPFKIADLVIMWPDTKNYCFVNTIPELEQELKDAGLQEKNVIFVNSVDNCNSNSVNVCFDGSSPKCGVIVLTNRKEVQYSGGGSVSYVESSDTSNKYGLLLAAIFSEPEKFNCQKKRLAARAANLASLYKLKSNFLTSTGKCRSAPLLPNSLQDYISKAEVIAGNGDLSQLIYAMEDLKLKNAGLECRLF